jgi:hypothetical protein
MPLGKLGKGGDKPEKKSKHQSDESEPMNEQQRKDMTGRNPDKPILGSEAWAKKNKIPPYDKD